MIALSFQLNINPEIAAKVARKFGDGKSEDLRGQLEAWAKEFKEDLEGDPEIGPYVRVEYSIEGEGFWQRGEAEGGNGQ